MDKLTERVSVSLKADASQALNHIKDQCDPHIRGLTSRIVSAAVLQLYEQSIGQNISVSIHFRPMPGCFINPNAVDPASATLSARPKLRLV